MTMKKLPRVLIADDHIIVSQGLQSLLEDEFDIVACVTDGRALIEAARRLKPDVVVADISMPVLNGLDAVRYMKKDGDATKVVFLTMHAEAAIAVEAFRAGASGYILKQSAGDELIAAIHASLEDRTDLILLSLRMCSSFSSVHAIAWINRRRDARRTNAEFCKCSLKAARLMKWRGRST